MVNSQKNYMKKIFIVLLSVLTVVTLVGCQKDSRESIDYSAYGWEVPVITDETFEQYYSREHVYYQRSENQLLFKEKNNGYAFVCDEKGIVLQVTSEQGKVTDYKIAEGNFTGYKDAVLYHDGYWFYFYTTDDSGNIEGFVRVNLKGEQQVIFEDIAQSGIMNSNGYIQNDCLKILDHNVMLAVCEATTGIVIKRYYLPDMTIEEYASPLIKGTVEYHLSEQINAEHIYYKGIDPNYYAKYSGLKADKQLADSLIDKYNLNSAYNNVKEKYLDYCLDDICRYVIWQEYGLYAYSTFDLNTGNKETSIKQIESIVDYPIYSQGYQR